MGTSTTTTTRTSMAEPGDLTSPEGGRPWEDQTLSSQERYDAYRSVITERCEALRESLKREGVTAEEKRVLAEDANNKALVAELRQLQSETAEEFCDRIDGGPMKRLLKEVLGKNFLGASEWQQGFNVAVGPVPPIPKWITKELLEGECELHPGQRVKDTHLLVLIPKTVAAISLLRRITGLVLVPKTAGGEPYSALKLGELCSKTKGSGARLISQKDLANKWKKESWANARQQESEWVLIPKSDPDPEKVSEDKHLRYRTISQQADVYKHYAAHYREAKALEVMTAALLNDVVNGEPRMLDGYNCLRCVEPNASGGRVVVGEFNANGLWVDVDFAGQAYDFFGGALVRKSKT